MNSGSFWIYVNIFISVRIVDVWNSLPAALLRFSNVDIFKRKLDCHFKNRGCE